MSGTAWDLLRHLQAVEVPADLRSGRGAGGALAAEASRLAMVQARQIETLTRLCQAMWSLLQEKTGLTEEDLKRRFEQMNGMGGQPAVPPVRCGTCGAMSDPRPGKCLFCGAPLGDAPPPAP